MTANKARVPKRPMAADGEELAVQPEPADSLSLERLDTLTYRLIRLGFVLLTLVITTGALWARYAWGRWWSWDPKETSALVAWFVYLLYLHGRRARWSKKATAWIAILGALSVLFCYVGVNLLPSIHAYGAPKGDLLEGAKQSFTGMQQTEALLTKGFLLFYLLAFIGYIAGTVFKSVASRKVLLLGLVPLAVGFVFHTLALGQRSFMSGRLPFSSGYEYAACFAWAMVLLLLIMQGRIRTPALGLASMPLVALILAYGFFWFPDKGISPLMPALQNMFWLHLHVAIAIISYAALLLATGTAVMFLIKSRGIREGGAPEEAPV